MFCCRVNSHTFLQISVHQVIFMALVIVFIRGLIIHHISMEPYRYSQLNRFQMQDFLFKVRNPRLEFKPHLPECDYSYLNSTDTISAEDYAKRIQFNEFAISNGSFVPADCNTYYSVAIIVTFRDRTEQLEKFIPYMHSFLKNQNIHYKIFIVKQNDDNMWNKGLLYNIGAKIAMDEEYPCLILHDVDLLPRNTANIYACLHYPRHMSVAVSTLRFVLPYNLVGGVLAIRSSQYELVNGFSNRFLGWGGEDDDFGKRLGWEMLPVLRFGPEMSRYDMIYHKSAKRNPNRMRLLAETHDKSSIDGFNSVKYESVNIVPHRLYTLIEVVTIPQPNYSN